MEIEIKSAEQFDSLLNSLSDEIVSAEVYFKLREDLLSSVVEYRDVFIQSNTFWSLISKAFLIATLSYMCRAYDQHSKSLSLINLLETVRVNLSIFKIVNFRERLRDSPFVESFSSEAREPNIEVLDRDISLVKENDPLVNKLIIWRNNIIAHKTAPNIVDEVDVTLNYPLSLDETRKLLTRATSILNKYSSLFRASSYSTQILGHDDYLYILRTLNDSFQKHEEEMKPLIEKTRQSDRRRCWISKRLAKLKDVRRRNA
ncbi:hypothetical protein ACFLYS_02275 [Chloroflexota bacterium]